MKKLLFLALLLPAIAKAQDVDSLKRYNDRYTKSAISAFTYNRLHTLINNMLTLIGQGGGGAGQDGRELLIRVSGGFIQTQYEGDASWTNLIALSALEGPQGPQGIQGIQGIPGSNATATTNAADLTSGILNNARLQDIPLSTVSGLVTALSAKLNYTDTALMLSPYATAIGLRATQSALQDSAFALRSAIAGGGSITIDAVPTDGSANAVSSNGAFDADQLRLLKSDTASMLAAYGNKINTKIGLSDTSAVLAPYQTALNGRVRYSDTASILAPYATKINTKYGSADTSALFTNYRNAINARVRYTDTASMLLPYANKINTKIGAADTASMLAAYQAALNEVVDIPIDEFPTLGSTNPATSGGIRTKLDSIVANMGTSGEVLATGLYTAMSGVTVPAGIDIVQTSGYGAIGRGAARYARTATAGAATWKFQSADGQWWELAEPVLNVDMFGAVGDGVTDNTTAIQSAIDYATTNTGRRNNQGAMLWITNGQYVTGVLTIKSGVTLNGGRAKGKGGFSPGSASGGGLKAHSSIPEGDFMIESESGAAGWAINGLQLIGAGSASTSGGIRAVGDGTTPARDFYITNNTIKDFGLEAVLVEYGSPFTITSNMIQGLNNRAYLLTRGTSTGAMRASGVDGTFMHNEFTGSANFAGSTTFQVSGAEMLLAAANFAGLEISKFTNNIYQVADAGLNHPGNTNTYTSERFDTNAGYGIFMNSGGSNNDFISPTIERNSLAGNNLYDGIYQSPSTGGRNRFFNPRFFAGAPVGVTTYNMRYYINDTKTDYAHVFTNHYEKPASFTNPGTAFYNFPAETEAGMSVSIADDVIYRLTGNNATPSVLNRKFLRAYNSTFTTITNFTDAVPGQIIYVIGNNTAGANTRLAHGTNIKLRKGSGHDTLSMDVPKMFINRGTFTNNIWIELSGDAVTSSGSGPVAIGDVTGLGTGVSDFLVTPSSANLATAVTGETGSGALVFGTSPTLTTPALGTPSAIVLTNGTGLPQSGVTGLTASLAAKMDTTANISGAATKASATWAAGTVTVNSNTQRHDILMTASGARTLVVSNINTVRSVVMWIDNTSGGTVTLTLPSNSFLQNPTTGVYASAVSVVIAQGKTVLTLSNFDGTNYWFNY